MKKLSNKGFTLIELLAVITIMGILMMVAIPAVSRTIENSRRDTFADIAHEYVNAVRNAYIADNISCFNGSWNTKDSIPQERVASATSKGDYYFPVCTDVIDECYSIYHDIPGHEDYLVLSKDQIVNSTNDLMESGGKSPFGSSDMVGYVRIQKTVTERETKPAKKNNKYCIINNDAVDADCDKTTLDENKCKCDLENEPTASDVPEGWQIWYKPLDNPKTTIHYFVKMVDTGYHGIASPIAESKVKRAAISTSVPEVIKEGTGENAREIPNLINVDYSDQNTAMLEEVKEGEGDNATLKGYKTKYLACFIN